MWEYNLHTHFTFVFILKRILRYSLIIIKRSIMLEQTETWLMHPEEEDMWYLPAIFNWEIFIFVDFKLKCPCRLVIVILLLLEKRNCFWDSCYCHCHYHHRCFVASLLLFLFPRLLVFDCWLWSLYPSIHPSMMCECVDLAAREDEYANWHSSSTGFRWWLGQNKCN